MARARRKPGAPARGPSFEVTSRNRHAFTLITPKRESILRAGVELALQLRRPPAAIEVARLLGFEKFYVREMLTVMRRLGMIAPHAGVRPTIAARRYLDLPITVYVAWPLPLPHAPSGHVEAAIRGSVLASWVLEGIPRAAPVTPYLVAHDARHRETIDAGAPTIAVACDGVIVDHDPLLLGRADVASAAAAGIPIAVVSEADRAEISMGADPWIPPRLAGDLVPVFHGRRRKLDK